MASFREKRIMQSPHGTGAVVRDSSLGLLHQSVHRFPSRNNQSNAALRSTFESKENSDNATNSITRRRPGKSGKTPMPSTPFSLLRQEVDDDDDLSLICSPLVVKTRPPTPGQSLSTSFVANQHRTENTTVSSSSSKENNSAHRSAMEPCIKQYSLRQAPGILSSDNSLPPLDSRRTTEFQPNCDDENNLLPSFRRLDNTSSPDETQTTHIVFTLPSPDYGESPCEPPYHAAIDPKHSETPFSITKKGVCMDLSDVFCGAVNNSTVAKKMKPTPARPPRQPALIPNPVGDVTDESDKFDDSQEKMFTNLLNQILCPIEDTESERGAFHGLVLQQKLSKMRRAFKQSFRSIDFEPLKGRILSGKLKLREDRDVSANLACRKDLIELMFSYSLPWLRLGLETVFATTFSSSDRVTLRNFIISQVVQDSNILNKYTHGKCKVPSGSFEASYRDELRTAVLFRVLSLVCFLDVAKGEELLNCPLFHRKAKLKSTKKLLFQFCCAFMKGEGNIVKHLGRLGLNVTVEQKATEELEFRIDNIKVDLSDGIRLTRLAEILSNASLVSKLRLPVVSRLQKFHNVNLALHHLQGVPKSILAHHFIDGHRQQVLRFLWSLVAFYFLPNLLTMDQVLTEVRRIQQLHRTTTALSDTCHDLAQALLLWSQQVCSFYAHEIHKLDNSFADGQAICYLIHYYHPYFIDLRIVRGNSNAWPVAKQGLSLIGGIPVFIPDANEQSVTLCLSFLFSRMIETRREVLSAYAIQCLFDDVEHVSSETENTTLLGSFCELGDRTRLPTFSTRDYFLLVQYGLSKLILQSIGLPL